MASNLDGDIHIAFASIAAELHVDLDVLPRPISERIVATLRALSAAHYGAGVRDTMVRYGNRQTHLANENVASATDATPVVGPHGRRLRRSKLPTVPVPPPLPYDEVDEQKRRR